MSARVIASFAGLPSRLRYLEPLLCSLTEQTRPPDQIILWMAAYYKRLDQRFDLTMLPKFFRKYPGVEVRLTEDLGPITKLFPTLQLDLNPDDIIAVFDDDVALPHSYIEVLKARAESGRAVYGHRGRILPDSLDYSKSELVCFDADADDFTEREVDILTVTGGMAFRRSLFGEDFPEFVRESTQRNPDLFKVDDIVINSYCESRGVPRIVVPSRGKFLDLGKKKLMLARSKTGRTTLKQAVITPDSLWDINENAQLNNAAIETFRSIWRTSKQRTGGG